MSDREITSQIETAAGNTESSSDEESYSKGSNESNFDSSEDEDDGLVYYEQTIRDISKGDRYTCMICTIEMDYTCKMYACQSCYRVFDYECIQEWAEKSASKTIDKVWKCPNCSHSSKQIPLRNRPTCWCGKVINPDPNELSPNSCGQTCNKKTCVHGCKNFCHLGPHGECSVITTLKCKCGRNEKDIFCHQLKKSNKNNVYQCNEVCQLPLACGVHKCKRVCHSGLCGACPEILSSEQIQSVESNENRKFKCYCGENSKNEIMCKKLAITGTFSKNSEGDKWIGTFACKTRRIVFYACNEHSFIEPCQAQLSISGKKICPYTPKLLNSCPCGKTSLKQLAQKRKKCTDPIPTCENRCGKALKCGKHTCPYICHNGSCMDPCIQLEVTNCSCLQKHFLVPCNFEQTPKCTFKCESLMSCRRHRCPKKCCTGKPEADKRKKMLLTREELNDESLVEAVHICLKECNLKLSCGIHDCTRKCHPGRCPSCLISDSNDLVCPCGKTVIEAPVRCGSKLPPCPFECIKVIERSYPCGHKPPPHQCHPSTEPCPPCTAVVERPCKCGKHHAVKAVCFQEFGSCGEICNKELENCHHKCQYKCHEIGQCQKSCKQVCNKDRANCNHQCKSKCHGSSPCPDVPCNEVTKVSCKCGRKQEYRKCYATLDNSSASIELLPCDEDCEAHARHLQLRDAFGYDSSLDTSNKNIQDIQSLMEKVSTYEELRLPYPQSVISTYSKQIKWCSQIEDILRKFVLDKAKNNLHFKPMKPAQRHFVRELSTSFNLYSESQDPEPKRSVFVKRKVDTRIPNISLEEVLPLWTGFKKLEKERKIQHFESTSQRKYINYEPKEVIVKSSNDTNGFFIKKISPGITEEDLSEVFGKALKSTLIKNVCYKILPESSDAIIYPEQYNSITESVHQDLEVLVGHFDFIGKEALIFDSIMLCNVEGYINQISDCTDTDKEKDSTSTSNE
ncbi:hypothetical protein TPHA_0D01530 [Tetrapisispora phaffii CBS 4417]|uniref:R3H domain-containing protein n=1 Tax=Tetrapisispora phaffii (strain ATCC 24235 / CBS 4417 / NBRC 1672 / NRRL Y-8282 / UCD 70-5) TaxID=1071381 RepID=G8BSH2_TETPH|nr:hypothetical protein TPHA_0D01530 [Tetrapisispora phaffii CBS 4417]CCE62793.1 hypothetical protein TPHA_0D01530 [Tetrapisispora phaffii CBS 4417]